MPGSAFGDSAYMEFQTGNQQDTDIDFQTPDFHELCVTLHRDFQYIAILLDKRWVSF
jgi:hypothetical protein